MVKPADCKSAALRGIGGSSPSASTRFCYYRLTVRTADFRSANRGSIPRSSSKVSIREVEKRKARIVHDNGDSTVSDFRWGIRKCSNCSCSFEDYGQRASLCRDCKRAYDREYHAKRTDEAKKRKQELQRKRIDENRIWLYEYFSEHPCVKCGEDDPVVLEFDHLDDTDKSFNISSKPYASKECMHQRRAP